MSVCTGKTIYTHRSATIADQDFGGGGGRGVIFVCFGFTIGGGVKFVCPDGRSGRKKIPLKKYYLGFLSEKNKKKTRWSIILPVHRRPANRQRCAAGSDRGDGTLPVHCNNIIMWCPRLTPSVLCRAGRSNVPLERVVNNITYYVKTNALYSLVSVYKMLLKSPSPRKRKLYIVLFLTGTVAFTKVENKLLMTRKKLKKKINIYYVNVIFVVIGCLFVKHTVYNFIIYYITINSCTTRFENSVV